MVGKGTRGEEKESGYNGGHGRGSQASGQEEEATGGGKE